MFRREVDGLFDRLFDDGSEWGQMINYVPRTNLAETDDAYEVTVELPGLKPEEVNVEFSDGQLWISGEKKEETEETGKTFHRVERRYGQFRRGIPLSHPIKGEDIEASFKDGVLTIRMLKSEDAKSRRISIAS